MQLSSDSIRIFFPSVHTTLGKFTSTDIAGLPAVWAAVLLLAVYKTFASLCLRPRKRRQYLETELDKLGSFRKKKLPGTAVCCGGSISGIITARVLADNFESVILVDPELSKCQEGQYKTRSISNDHAHGYMIMLMQIFRRLWPTFDSAVIQAGGMFAPADYKTHVSGVNTPAPHPEYASGLPETAYIRRQLLDLELQKLLLSSSPNVRTLDGRVQRIVPSADRKRVDHVVVSDVNGVKIDIPNIALLTDCTGSAQGGLKWLRAAGYTLPDNLRLAYNPNLTYVTVTCTVSASLEKKICALDIPCGYNDGAWYNFAPAAELCRVAILILKTDNSKIQICCGAWGSDLTPRTSEELVAYIHLLKGHKEVPRWVFDVMKLLAFEGLPVFKSLRLPPCSYIRYHLASSLPANLCSVGDAMMSLNPIYGQGCTKAGIQALALNKLLMETTDGLALDFAQRFYMTSASRIEVLWDAAKANDYGFPTTTPVQGETLKTGWLTRWFGNQLILASGQSMQVASALWHVRNLCAPPADMIAPGVLLGIAYASWIRVYGRLLVVVAATLSK